MKLAAKPVNKAQSGDELRHLLDHRRLIVLERIGQSSTARFRCRYVEKSEKGPDKYLEGIFWASELEWPNGQPGG